MAAPKTKSKLKVDQRKVVGRKVKKLRREGILPANLYGKKVKSQALKLDLKSFLPVYQEVGETRVVNLQIKGDTQARPVLIHNVQVHPVSGAPLHADFYQVSLKEKVTTEIPVELVGESPAVKEKLGVLIQPLLEVEVEALPTELPDRFQVEIGQLEKVDDAFAVGDLKVPKGVKILTGAKEILAKIEPLTMEEEMISPKEEEEGEEKIEEEVEEETETVIEGEKLSPKEVPPSTPERPQSKPQKGESKKKKEPAA